MFVFFFLCFRLRRLCGTGSWWTTSSPSGKDRLRKWRRMNTRRFIRLSLRLVHPYCCCSVCETLTFGCRKSKCSFLRQESDDPLAHIHFTAEGEVTFRSILFVPTSAPRGLFDEYGSKKNDFIKVCIQQKQILRLQPEANAELPYSLLRTAWA